MRRANIAAYLRREKGILSLEDLPDIGSEKYDFVDHCLNPQGALDANLPDAMQDIATVNLIVLQQLLEKDLLDSSNPRRWTLKPGVFFYYYDRPDFSLTDVLLSEAARP